MPAETVYKVNEGRPNVVDLIKNGQIDIVFNTPLGGESFYDDGAIRKSATLHDVLVRHDADGHGGHRAGDPGAARAGDRHPEPAGDPLSAGTRAGEVGVSAWARR